MMILNQIDEYCTLFIINDDDIQIDEYLLYVTVVMIDCDDIQIDEYDIYNN